MKKAAAIKYSVGMPAPFVVAKGKGKLAERIIEIALQNGITINCNKDVADALVEIESGELVPEEYYEIVAEILVFAARLENRLTGKKPTA